MLKKGMAGEKKKKSWNWWGNPNTSNFYREQQRPFASNPRLEQAVNDLFATLKANEPQHSGEQLIENVERDFELKNGEGLLKKISEKTPLNFWFLADENFSLEELEKLNLADFKFLNDTEPLKLGIEKIIVKNIKNQFKSWLSKELSRSFSERVKYNANSLSELLTAIQLFAQHQITNPEEKKEFISFSKNFRITFQNLKSELEKADPPIALDELNTKSFSEWSAPQQKAFDTLFTKTVLNRLKARVQQAKKLTQDIGESFWKTFSLSTLFSKFPWKYEDLYTLAQENYPESAQKLNDLEEAFAWTSEKEKTEAEKQELLKKIEEEYWNIYLAEVKRKDEKMAQALTFLYEKNFDFTSLNQQPELRDYFLGQLAEIRYEEMRKNNALEIFGGDSEEFKKFFKSLLDFSTDEIEINGVKLKVEKSLLEGDHHELKDLWNFSTFDGFPLQIKVSGFKDANFSLEDQEKINRLFKDDIEEDTLNLKGRKVGKLLLFFLMGQATALEALDPGSKEAKKFENLMEGLDKQNAITKEKRKLNEENNPDENNNPDEQKEDTPEERNKKFLESWKSIRGENSETPDGGFVPWSILYFPVYESQLPPFNGSNDRSKAEITHVDWKKWTFRVKFSGSELGIKDDGKESKSDFYFEGFEKNFANNEHYLGKPFKILSWKKNLEKTMQEMQKNGICSENILGNAKLEDWKITLTDLDDKGEEIKEEVKYFWTAENVAEKDRVLYEIQNNSNNTITLKSSHFFDGEGNSKKREKTMTYPDFLIFLNEKKLSPKTGKMAEREKKAISDIGSKKNRKLKWTSIHSLIYSVKNIWKTLNSKLDEYQKEQDEKCLDWLVSDVWIYKGLNKAFGWMAPSLRDSFTRLHDEAISGIEKKNWKEIETRITLFKGVEFADIFEKGKDPATGERMALLDAKLGKRGTLKNVLKSRHCVINDDKLRPIMAAAMISNLKEGKGLYRGMPECDNQGLWIQCLLWPEHYQRYLQYKRNIQADIDSGVADADQLRDLLVKSETNYIVYNIQNSHGKDKYFGSVDDKNQQALKKIYSNEFASQLSNAAWEMTGYDAIEASYGKSKKMNTFNVAEEDFKKNIKSGRIEAWLWVLKRMGELAKTEEQRARLASSMSYITLSWILNKYADKNTMTWFDGLARSFMLPTAFFADKPYHQRYAWHLLNQVPVVPKFSEVMREKSLTEAQFSTTSSSVPYGTLLTELWSWWATNTKVIDRYFLSLKAKDHSGDPVLEKITEVLWEQDPDNLDNVWAGKPKITWHYALNATPATIEQNKSYKRGMFDGKDQDERNDKATFRKSLLDDLESAKSNPEFKPDFFLRQFVTWFNKDGFSDANAFENISWIRAIKDVKENMRYPRIKFTDTTPTSSSPDGTSVMTNSGYNQDDLKATIRYLFKGKILKQGSSQPPTELNAVLDFFVKYFEDHFDEISSDRVLKKVFWEEAFKSKESRVVKFVPISEYKQYAGKDDYILDRDEEVDDSDASDEARRKRDRNWKKRNYKSDDFLNRRLIEMEKALNRMNVTWVPPLVGSGGVNIKSVGVER